MILKPHLVSAPLIALVIGGCWAAPAGYAPTTEELCQLPASAPATAPTSAPLREIAAHYSQVGGIGPHQEITVQADGRYRWTLYGCTGETDVDGAASLSGDRLR